MFFVHVWAQLRATHTKTHSKRLRLKGTEIKTQCVRWYLLQCYVARCVDISLVKRNDLQAKEEAEKQLSRVLAPRIACCKPFVSQFFFFFKKHIFIIIIIIIIIIVIINGFHMFPPGTFVLRGISINPLGWKYGIHSHPHQVDRVYQQVALPSDAWSGGKIWQKMLGSSMGFQVCLVLFGMMVTLRR